MFKKLWPKAIAACLLAGALSMGTAFAANTDEVRVIPYPAGLNTKTEGASSAPTDKSCGFSILQSFEYL